MRLLRRKIRLYSSSNTSLAAALTVSSKASPNGGWPRMMQGESIDSWWMHSNTFTVNVLHIVTSSLRMWCWTSGTRLSSSILDFQHAFLMSKKSKYSAAHHRTWHQKLCAKPSFADHQQISTLLVSYCSPSSADSFLLEVKMTRSCTIRSWQVTWMFQTMCHQALEA